MHYPYPPQRISFHFTYFNFSNASITTILIKQIYLSTLFLKETHICLYVYMLFLLLSLFLFSFVFWFILVVCSFFIFGWTNRCKYFVCSPSAIKFVWYICCVFSAIHIFCCLFFSVLYFPFHLSFICVKPFRMMTPRKKAVQTFEKQMGGSSVIYSIADRSNSYLKSLTNQMQCDSERKSERKKIIIRNGKTILQ